MAKLLLLSVLAVTVAMPSLAAREANPVRGVKKLLAQLLAFSFLYWLVVMFLTPEV
jgi:hypothetical protein